MAKRETNDGRDPVTNMAKTKRNVTKPAPKVAPKATRDTGVDTDWFKARAKEQGFTVRSLAEHLGYPNYGPVQRLLAGLRRLRVDEVAPFAKALKVPAQEVLSRAGMTATGFAEIEAMARIDPSVPAAMVAAGTPGMVRPGASQIRVVGWVDGAGIVHHADLGVVVGKIEGIPVGAEDGYAAIKLQTFGAGAIGNAMDGAVAVFRKTFERPEGFVGKMCVVELDDGRWVIGVLNRSALPGKWVVFGLDAGVKHSDIIAAGASKVVSIRFHEEN